MAGSRSEPWPLIGGLDILMTMQINLIGSYYCTYQDDGVNGNYYFVTTQ